MRTYIKELAKRLPVPIKNLGHIAYDLLPPTWRYGKPYKEAIKLLNESQNWDESRLRDYQDVQIQKLIRHSFENVPYYRDVFNERGLTPKDIRCVDDLQKLPFLTKAIVRRRVQDLTARNVSFLNMEPAHTTGSSGTPLNFFMDETTRPFDRALVLRHLRWLGYEAGDRSVFFKCLPLTDPTKLYQYFPGSRELRITFHNENETKLRRMAEVMRDFAPDFINAWPSCLYVLSRYMERNGITIKPPKFIVTSSENCFPTVKQQIRRVFKCPIIDWYGQEESVAVAAQCLEATGYHVQVEMSVIEFLPFRDGMSEVVGTCLHNFAMPFIRYKTGDLAVPSDHSCPCGRKHPLIDGIVGRNIDFVRTPEGNVISPLILHFAFFELDEIKEGQIIQEDINTLRIIVVPWKNLSPATLKVLEHELYARLESPSMKLIFEEAVDIPTANTLLKRPFVISRIPVE